MTAAADALGLDGVTGVGVTVVAEVSNGLGVPWVGGCKELLGARVCSIGSSSCMACGASGGVGVGEEGACLRADVPIIESWVLP